MQSRELSSWASGVAGREIHTYIHARAYDSSTQPSICITSFLRRQTAPQPFVMITELFQLKDKSCSLPYSCLLSGRWPWELAIHLWEDFERAGESPPTLAPKCYLWRPHYFPPFEEQKLANGLVLSRMEALSSSLFTVQQGFFFFPEKWRLPLHIQHWFIVMI